MHAIEWHRVIVRNFVAYIYAFANYLTARFQLDEAHNIKERATNTAKATFELQATYRWCLSGTPLQNRVGELYSLVRFLGGDPFSYYFCKEKVYQASLQLTSLIVRFKVNNVIASHCTGSLVTKEVVMVCPGCRSSSFWLTVRLSQIVDIVQCTTYVPFTSVWKEAS